MPVPKQGQRQWQTITAVLESCANGVPIVVSPHLRCKPNRRDAVIIASTRGKDGDALRGKAHSEARDLPLNANAIAETELRLR